MSDLSSAIKQICDEKGLSYEAVLVTIESALSAAYRKDFGKKNQNISVEFDPKTGKSKVFDVKTVVEDMPEAEEEEEEDLAGKTEIKEKVKKIEKTETKEKTEKSTDKKEGEKPEDSSEEIEEERKFNPKTEIQISDAKLLKKTAKIGDEIKIKLDIPDSYGRMAAQTAKQVIIQRLREAEREMIFEDFKEKEKEVVSGVIQRREGKIVLIDLGKAVGVLPYEEMIPGETYKSGDRIKVFVKEVGLKSKGPEIVLSRTSEEILKKVFYLEIPEISNGLIEIKVVAREAGFRSKVAVWTDSDNVDPIGSCVGQRGARIQTIISELGGEKVDIILYDDDPVKFITNSLSPAKIIGITINEKEKKAVVKVLEDQLSLAIGKGGQNARLAAKLTGWKIDIVEEKSKKAEDKKEEDSSEAEVSKKEEKKEKKNDKKEETGMKVDEEKKKEEKKNDYKKEKVKDGKESKENKEEKKADEKKKKDDLSSAEATKKEDEKDKEKAEEKKEK